MKVEVVTLENKKIEDIELRDDIFGLPIRKDILHRVVEWQRAKARAGTQSLKNITDVLATTKKPWNQKGTGRARQGALNRPHMVGGGLAHAPKPRSYEYKLNKKFRTLALKTALSLKLSEGSLRIIDTAEVSSPKTKELTSAFEKAGIAKALFVRGSADKDNFFLASRSIKYIDVLPQYGLNVYDILKHEQLIITKHALTDLQNRLANDK
jgi:large subunit ribosomal protein L4